MGSMMGCSNNQRSMSISDTIDNLRSFQQRLDVKVLNDFHQYDDSQISIYCEGDFRKISLNKSNQEELQQQMHIGPHMISQAQEKVDDNYYKKLKIWSDHLQSVDRKLQQENEDLEKIEVFRSQSNCFVNDKESFVINMCQKENQKKFQHSIKTEGAPAPIRWPIWKINLLKHIQFIPGLYEQLIKNCTQQNIHNINKDIPRTFPKQSFFSLAPEQLGQIMLKRVLLALSNYFPEQGYCQGMNFILGFLLIVNGGSESDAFYAYIALSTKPQYFFLGVFDRKVPIVHFIQHICLYRFKKKMPKLEAHFKQMMIDPSFWLTKWVLTLFIYTFTLKICARIWDFILLEGIFGIAQLIVPILKNYEKTLLNYNELMILDFFQRMENNSPLYDDPTSLFYININDTIQKATQIKFKQSFIVEQVEKFQKLFVDLKDDPYIQCYAHYNDDQMFREKVQSVVESKQAEYIKKREIEFKN